MNVWNENGAVTCNTSSSGHVITVMLTRFALSFNRSIDLSALDVCREEIKLFRADKERKTTVNDTMRGSENRHGNVKSDLLPSSLSGVGRSFLEPIRLAFGNRLVIGMSLAHDRRLPADTMDPSIRIIKSKTFLSFVATQAKPKAPRLRKKFRECQLEG
jgi:hypothetical protein